MARQPRSAHTRCIWRPGLVFAVLVVATAAEPAVSKSATTIVGGSTAEGYPAQAEVDYRGSLECGGSLIAPRWVLTAAHCVTSDSGVSRVARSTLRVRLGSSQLGAGTPYRVIRIDRNPLYDSPSARDDAALLQLARAAPETPLPLLAPAGAAAAAPRASARVLGWGVTSEDSVQPSPSLLQADVPIVDDSACKAAYSGGHEAGTPYFDPKTMLCAGASSGGADACSGDSGGPLMVQSAPAGENVRWVLVGLVSWGNGCGEAGRPGVYTRLLNPSVRSWIARTLAGPLTALDRRRRAALRRCAPLEGARRARCVRRAQSLGRVQTASRRPAHSRHGR